MPLRFGWAGCGPALIWLGCAGLAPTIRRLIPFFLDQENRSVRRYLIAGNWKMNLLAEQGIALVEALRAGPGPGPNCDVLVCPPLVYLERIAAAVNGSPIALGAQNLYPGEFGAFTGEVSGAMLVDVGCTYVIVGHSERRALCGESDAVVNAKVQAALGAGLTPIVCVGETLEQRQAGETEQVVVGQLRGSLADLGPGAVARCVIAYEPVWAIGTGQTATPEQAQQVHAVIRQEIAGGVDPHVADQLRLLYGGSVKADNATELLGQPDIDGALVGGASLQAAQFLAIIAAAQ